ncbi:MAG TPA: alkaline phosphatase family protein [Thermoanaerobaculia bacterium]|nr:alkaline phosphatase family protein [Thermoanaerobaculia bacterium]
MTRTPAATRRIRRRLATAALAAAGALAATPALAYIGPGAGFALLSSFMVLFTTIVLAGASLLVWPFRMLWRAARRKRPPKARVRRLIVVGLDGQDPQITDRLMAEGKLPNFQKLADQGAYRRIQTTYPALSPVAWSSFSTGTNPGKHNIFDFLDRDLRSYLPKLSSTYIGRLERFLTIGKYRIPLRKPELRLLRKSKPFWTILGEHNIWSTVLRVPITFPPDRFYGAQLAAMCVPDLLGTQGTFLLFTTRPATTEFKEGGQRVVLAGDPGASRFETTIDGPENTFLASGEPLRVPLVIELDRSSNGTSGGASGAAAGSVRLAFGDRSITLRAGELSDWQTLEFPALPGIKVRGLTRMKVLEMDEHFSLYLSPINIDPERPAMPVSHPGYYATYLSKRVGPFSTLGLAEDTWALNEGVTDDETFLRQAYDIDGERERMFFAALDRLHRGSLVCVFDGTDRIQHMFWRYTEDGHPAARTNGNGAGPEHAEKPEPTAKPEHHDAIEKLYLHNDALVGRVMAKLRSGDLLMVLSDHGFASFRRGVNLNRWLLDNGYLALREGATGREEWLTGVDWSRTRAYALGLSGVFLNLEGREAGGIVKPGAEAERLEAELVAGLSGLPDALRGEVAIREAFDTSRIYSGPYQKNAPDLLIGYNRGYRTSWDCATGVVAAPLFEDNTKAWSGDHCIDPRLVPGVFFCNRPVDAEDPSLLDIAPTALELFGIRPPAHMEGKPIFSNETLTAMQPT